MSSRVIIICVVVMLTSEIASAVILRPKWFPYFRKENTGETTSSPSQGVQSSEALSMRQARTINTEGSACQDDLTSEQCVSLVLMVVNRLLRADNRQNVY